MAECRREIAPAKTKEQAVPIAIGGQEFGRIDGRLEAMSKQLEILVGRGATR